MDLTGTDSPKSNKSGQGSLAGTLESRVFPRWMSYIDILFVIMGSAALVFGTLAFVGVIDIRDRKLMMKDEAELDMESDKAWHLGDITIILGRIHFDVTLFPQWLFGTVAFLLYVACSLLPLLGASVLHQSASEKATHETRIFLVKVWLVFNAASAVMIVAAGVVDYFPKFLCLCLAIVGLRLVLTFFVIKYLAQLQHAVEEGSAVKTSTNRIPAFVV